MDLEVTDVSNFAPSIAVPARSCSSISHELQGSSAVGFFEERVIPPMKRKNVVEKCIEILGGYWVESVERSKVI